MVILSLIKKVTENKSKDLISNLKDKENNIKSRFSVRSLRSSFKKNIKGETKQSIHNLAVCTTIFLSKTT